jgi:hypothetical protein
MSYADYLPFLVQAGLAAVITAAVYPPGKVNGHASIFLGQLGAIVGLKQGGTPEGRFWSMCKLYCKDHIRFNCG